MAGGESRGEKQQLSPAASASSATAPIAPRWLRARSSRAPLSLRLLLALRSAPGKDPLVLCFTGGRQFSSPILMLRLSHGRSAAAAAAAVSHAAPQAARKKRVVAPAQCLSSVRALLSLPGAFQSNSAAATHTHTNTGQTHMHAAIGALMLSRRQRRRRRPIRRQRHCTGDDGSGGGASVGRR